jgi:hypothetical protein
MDGPHNKTDDYHATPETREAVRSQIVNQGLAVSADIAAALDLRHATVVRILQRFAAVGALSLEASSTGSDGVVVAADSLTDRFRDLSSPLW